MNEKVKWIFLFVILAVGVFGYTYFMMYWSDVALPIIEYIKPNNQFITSTLLILLNALGIGVLGFLLVLPINYLFGHKGYIASFGVAAAIAVWNVMVWFMYIPKMPNYITIIEWVSIIIAFPVMSIICFKIPIIRNSLKSA